MRETRVRGIGLRHAEQLPCPTACGRLARMSTYEYMTSVITHGFLGRKEDELDRQELERELNRMGAEGWELAKVITGMALHREKDGHLLLFKRRVS
jgi:uncharacterized protein DUF4177